MKSQYVTIRMTLRQAHAVEAVLLEQLATKQWSYTLTGAAARIADVVKQADVESQRKSERIWREYRWTEACGLAANQKRRKDAP